MKICKGETGFATIVVIAIVVLAAIGFAGYRVYQARQTKPETTTQSTNATTKTTVKSTPTVSYLNIEPLKVRLVSTAAISGLKFGKVKTSSYNTADQSVAIIAPELDSSWSCGSDGEEGFKGTIGTVSITTQAKRSGPYAPTVTKKVDGKTYGFEVGGSGYCTNNDKYGELVKAFEAQFETLAAY